MAKQFIQTSQLLAVATLLSAQFSSAAEPLRPPNIVVIMADDLGWMDLNFQGNKLLDTPNLDRLASEGMRFTNAYAAAPVCTPTRAAMMTGQSPARLAITNHAPGNPDHVSPKTSLKGADWQTYLDLKHVTLAERLQQANYATGFIGKWHLSHRPGKDQDGLLEPRLRPEHQGFDVNIGGCRMGGPPSYFEPYKIPNIPPRKTGDYLPERLADESIDFVMQHRNEPFFLCWWNYSVHYPIQAPQHLVEKYKQRPGVENPGYAAMIEGMDTAIGRLLKAMDDTGMSKNTFVLFTSDNGSLFGNKPLRRNKGYLYEGGIRVPWVVRWPGKVVAGTTCDTPVITTDAFPTILNVANVELEDEYVCDGESILPLVEQTDTLTRESLYFHYPNYAFHKQNRLGSAIRENSHKLIRWYDDDSVELYDLSNDLSESKNLAADKPKLAARLRKNLEAWLDNSGAKKPTKVSPK